MGFFEPPAPQPEQPRMRPPEWLGPPENVLGAPVPLRVVLARTADVVAAISGCRAFPSGLLFDVALRLRPGGVSPDRRRAIAHGLPFHLHGPPDPAGLPPELFRFGVVLADGRKATTVDDRLVFLRDSPPDGAVLIQRGGGGGEHTWDVSFWLWPLPPAGPLAFVVEWPAFDIGETRVETDATPIVDAAATAETIWPEGGGPGFSSSQHVYSRATGQTDDG